MAKSTGITYIKVAGEDIQGAMKASEKSTDLSNKVEGQDSAVWGQTVHILMTRNTLVSTDNTAEGIKVMGENLKAIMSKVIFDTVVIPETGKNRDGQDFKVTDDKGVPKWASWAATRRIWAYIGDIAKVLCNGLSSELYPETGKVCPRCDILKQCKGTESPIEAITRHCKATTEALGKVSGPVDILQANTLINALVVPGTDPVDYCNDMISKMDAALSVMDSDQRDAVRAILTRLTKHFV